MGLLDVVRIQHDNSTGRYHPAWYSLAPLPGPGPDLVLRYKSQGHHTTGFATLDEARAEVINLAAKVDAPVPDDGSVLVVEMTEVGADVLLLDPEVTR